MALGDVDSNVGDVATPKEGEGAVLVPPVQPFRLAELDGDLEPEHPLLHLLHVRERAR